MFVYLTNVIGEVFDASFWTGQASFMPFYGLAWKIAFAIDLVFGTLGYCLTFRLLDSHIRSSDPTLFGWAVTLACYQPFSRLFLNQYLDYQDDFSWSTWLADIPVMQILWGSVTIALLAAHAWSVLTFGCRFSNLTHRGVLTHGPFRWTKHPSYLSKNLIWWLVSIPFISNGGFEEGVRNCLLLLGVNFIYFLRARTEERHLSRDPAYVAYALWIERHGALRSIGRIFPMLRYIPPVRSLNPDQST
jgi:protein-S-isoprenylcysteine O-methyltransferase Ste14